MKNETLESSQMGLNDFDAPDMERIQQQQQPRPSSWQINYDESTDPPSPWWFNSSTGESTWENPVIADETEANGGSGLANAGESLLPRGVEGGWFVGRPIGYLSPHPLPSRSVCPPFFTLSILRSHLHLAATFAVA